MKEKYFLHSVERNFYAKALMVNFPNYKQKIQTLDDNRLMNAYYAFSEKESIDYITL